MENKNKEVVLVPTINKTTKELSKIQKQFNTKSKKVETLKKEVDIIETTIPTLKQRIHQEIMPLRTAIAKAQAECIVLLDEASYHKSINKGEKDKIRDFICEHAMPLIENHKHTELIPIFNKYSVDTYDEIQQANIEEGRKMAEEMFKNMGVKVDLDDIDFKDSQNFMEDIMAKIHENMEDIKEKIEENNQKSAEEDAKRRKNAKEIAREKIQQQQAEAMNKTLKELYNQLVKEFHPDKEQDIEKKAWRTEVMKDITAAYQNKDFFGLLKLQLQFEQRDAKSFEELPDEKLKHFIKILDEQIEDLLSQLEMLKNVPPTSTELQELGQLLEEPKKIDATFKYRKQMLTRLQADAEHDARRFKDIKQVKKFLKEYETYEENEDLEALFEMLMKMK
jgi:hypothetical protein